MRRVSAVLCLVILSACGDSPTSPAPIQQPPPQQQPVNQAPVVESVVVSTQRAEADTDVTVTATVRDAETPVDQLRFDWTATAGTVTGTGATVRWRLPRGAATPAEHTVTLTVVETYATGLHSVTASSPAVRVHDSLRELGDLALRFLGEFANSDIPADVAVREFSDSCRGKQDEREDITANRRDFDVLSSRLDLAHTRVTTPWAAGEMTVRCEFRSRVKNCPPNAVSSCRVGNVDHVEGQCNLTAVYQQQRWLLCSSTFAGQLLPSMREFFGSDR